LSGAGPKSGSGSANCTASAPVITATTPSSARAAVTSIETILAWACGLRTIAACSIPSTRRSST
jgi:hypothetical protein